MPKHFIHTFNFLLSLSIALLVAYIINSTLHSERRLRLGLEQEHIFDDALILRGELESKLSNTHLIPFTFRSQLRQTPLLSHAQFAELASELIGQSPFIKNIMLIQGDRVVNIYPKSYDQTELGDRLSNTSKKNNLYFKAQSQRRTLISAPFTSNTGSRMIELSTPIFLKREYWGQIHVTVDWYKLLSSETYQLLNKNYRITIYDTEDSPTHENTTAINNSLYINTNLINQLWEIQITPKTHWNNEKVIGYHYPAVLLSLIFTFVGIYYWLRQNQALRREHNAALKAVKEKNRFLSYAAHDLRQPLSALSFSVEELLQRQQSSLDSRLTKNMLSSIHNLNELFDQLLDIEQINNQKKVVSLSIIPLHDLIDELTSELDPIFKEFSIGLLSRCNEIYIQTDPVLLKRILRNLIINGLESTSQGYVSLSCHLDNSHIDQEHPPLVTIRVRDTGEGIDIDQQENIFDIFQQRNEKKQQVSVGIGAGLNIVKNYCQLLGIDIQLDSTKGIGSEFILRLDSHEKSTLPQPNSGHRIPSPLNGVKAFSYKLDTKQQELIKHWGLTLSPIESLLVASEIPDTSKPVFIFINAEHLTMPPVKDQHTEAISALPHNAHCIIIGSKNQLETATIVFGNTPHISLSNKHTPPVRLRALLIQQLSLMQNSNR